jgi:hypothetical protein
MKSLSPYIIQRIEEVAGSNRRQSIKVTNYTVHPSRSNQVSVLIASLLRYSVFRLVYPPEKCNKSAYPKICLSSSTQQYTDLNLNE